MESDKLIALFEAANAGRYGAMVDRAREAADHDSTALLFALVSTCCDLADRVAAASGLPTAEVLAEQAALATQFFGSRSVPVA